MVSFSNQLPQAICVRRIIAFDNPSTSRLRRIHHITTLRSENSRRRSSAGWALETYLRPQTPVYRYSRSGVAALRPILYRCLQELLVKSITPGPSLRLVVTTCSLRVVLSIYDLRVNLFDCRKRKLDVYLGVCYAAISHLR